MAITTSTRDSPGRGQSCSLACTTFLTDAPKYSLSLLAALCARLSCLHHHSSSPDITSHHSCLQIADHNVYIARIHRPCTIRHPLLHVTMCIHPHTHTPPCQPSRCRLFFSILSYLLLFSFRPTPQPASLPTINPLNDPTSSAVASTIILNDLIQPSFLPPCEHGEEDGDMHAHAFGEFIQSIPPIHPHMSHHGLENNRHSV